MGENEEKKPVELTELDKKIIKQMEYYFGDKNLMRDKFLQEKIHEGEGWVSLECLITFNRLKVLTTDFDVILSALKKSDAGLLEFDDEKKRVKRSESKPPPARTDPEVQKISKQKTVYAKGFPVDYTMDKLEEFFEGKGETTFIKMRRDDQKAFKGSIFVEFKTPEIAQEFLGLKDLKIGETELEIMSRDDFYKQKDEEKKAHKTGGQPQERHEPKHDYEKGCVLHFKGAGDETSREDLKELFSGHGEVSWVDFVRNDTEGKIRFREEGAAQKAIDSLKKANDDKIVVKGVEAEVRVLEGDEEAEYWKQAAREKAQSRLRKGGRGRRNTQRGGNKRPWQTRNRENTRDAGNTTEAKISTESKAGHKRFDNGGPVQTEASEEPKAKQVKVE